MLAFCRFNERVLFVTMLKTEGFFNYQMLARLANEYLTSLYDQIYAKDDPKPTNVNESMVSILSKRANIDQDEDSNRHMLSLRDLRLAVKLANLIKE